MNVGDIIGNVFMYTGLVGLVLALLVKLLTYSYKQYMVHCKRLDGSPTYDMIKAFSKRGAKIKAIQKHLGEFTAVTKVVRYREERL